MTATGGEDKRLVLISLLVILILQACGNTTVFKDNIDFEGNNWFEKNVPSFAFTIDDPTVTYNVFYNVRNTLAYPYSNLYLTRYLVDEKGKVINTQLDELTLADSKSGKPFGSGLGDIYDHKILVLKAYKFPAKGKYAFRIKQFMRQNPLPEVLSVGITVEKSL